MGNAKYMGVHSKVYQNGPTCYIPSSSLLRDQVQHREEGQDPWWQDHPPQCVQEVQRTKVRRLPHAPPGNPSAEANPVRSPCKEQEERVPRIRRLPLCQVRPRSHRSCFLDRGAKDREAGSQEPEEGIQVNYRYRFKWLTTL